MSIERVQQSNLSDDNYHNEDYIRKVFEGDNRAEIETIQQVHNLTDG